MPAISKSACYNAGRNDAKAGRPRNSKGYAEPQRYHDAYSKTVKAMMKKGLDTAMITSRRNPMAVCAATGVQKPERSMGAYDVANDEFFVTGAAMDAWHGVTP